jgi:hypothetical protein
MELISKPSVRDPTGDCLSTDRFDLAFFHARPPRFAYSTAIVCCGWVHRTAGLNNSIFGVRHKRQHPCLTDKSAVFYLFFFLKGSPFFNHALGNGKTHCQSTIGLFASLPQPELVATGPCLY